MFLRGSRKFIPNFFDKDPDNPVPVDKLFSKYGDYMQLAVHYIWADLWGNGKTFTFAFNLSKILSLYGKILTPKILKA